MQHSARVTGEQLQDYGMDVLMSVNPELRFQVGNISRAGLEELSNLLQPDDDGKPMTWDEARARFDAIQAQAEDDEEDEDDLDDDWDEDEEDDDLDDPDEDDLYDDLD